MRIPGSNKTNYFTRIMITDVEHEIDALGHYNGQFKAIAADTGYLPKPYYDLSSAEPQIATVVSNADPTGQGRIKVRFEWQMHETTDFIRVMTPDAGGSDKVLKNRGYVFIPEVGDQVVVGFTEGHPDRPFVLGSMFHGNIGLGGGINNHLKTIQTREAVGISMNDTVKSQRVFVPSGAYIELDNEGCITIHAPKNIILNAGEDIIMNAGHNMKTNVANDNITQINNDHTFTAKNYNQTVNNNKTINVVGDLKETTSTTVHKAKNGDILIQSAGVAKVLGKIDAKVNKG